MNDDRSEQKKRSLVKTITWRAIASTDTLVLSFVVMTLIGPHSLGTTSITAGLIALLEIPNKLFLYYLHERIWQRLKFGRIKAPDYQI